MLTIKIESWKVLLIILALLALFALWGIREGRHRERLSQAQEISEAAQYQYAYTMDSLQREKSADSLRFVYITKENERLLKDIRSIRKNYDKKRLEIMVLAPDSVVMQFNRLRSGLDSLLSGKYIKD
jgi:hypothetical protein